MFLENPAKFYRILGWADAETEATPIQYEVAKAEAERKANNKNSANKSINRRAPVSPPATSSKGTPGYDPADDPGDALVNPD